MIFLIRYDRTAGQVISLQSFKNEERQQAIDARLDLELELASQCVSAEVVLLEADSEAALRKTHQRYFENIETLAESNLNEK